MGGGRDVIDAPKFAVYGFDEHAGTWESPEAHPEITATNWIWSPDDKVKRWQRSAFFVDKTLDFLERNKEAPCFVNLWFDDVHTPWSGSGHYVIYMRQAIAPMHECRNDRDICASFVRRAESAGYAAIVVTLDTLALGYSYNAQREERINQGGQGNPLGAITNQYERTVVHGAQGQAARQWSRIHLVVGGEFYYDRVRAPSFAFDPASGAVTPARPRVPDKSTCGRCSASSSGTARTPSRPSCGG